MDFLEILTIAFIIFLALVVVFAIVMAIITPSCEERGGVEVFSHYDNVTVLVGKVPVFTRQARYDCVGAG